MPRLDDRTDQTVETTWAADGTNLNTQLTTAESLSIHAVNSIVGVALVDVAHKREPARVAAVKVSRDVHVAELTPPLKKIGKEGTRKICQDRWVTKGRKTTERTVRQGKQEAPLRVVPLEASGFR